MVSNSFSLFCLCSGAHLETSYLRLTYLAALKMKTGKLILTPDLLTEVYEELKARACFQSYPLPSCVRSPFIYGELGGNSRMLSLRTLFWGGIFATAKLGFAPKPVFLELDLSRNCDAQLCFRLCKIKSRRVIWPADLELPEICTMRSAEMRKGESINTNQHAGGF